MTVDLTPGQTVTITATWLPIAGRTGTITAVSPNGYMAHVDLHDGTRPWWVHRNNLTPTEDQ